MSASQHRSVLAPAASTVPTDRIPPTTGTISICPSTHHTYDFFSSALSKEIPEANVAPLSEDTIGLIWIDSGGSSAADSLAEVLQTFPGIRWIQLTMAGVNAFETVIKSHKDKVWTSAKGSFAQPVAEHALALLLALLRNLPKRVRANTWGTPSGLSLFSRRVTIIGAGGITLSLLSLLAPFQVDITILRRKAEPLDDQVLPLSYRSTGEGSDKLKVDSFQNLHAFLPTTDVLIIAAALTSETHGMIGQAELEALPRHAIVINIARGEHIQTDALVSALERGTIAGAGLDVTSPEPLPPHHPLWTLQRSSPDASSQSQLEADSAANLIITPHTADTLEMVRPLLVQRFVANMLALREGEGRFEGVVDPEWAY